jgi:hypothetical protein
VVTSSVHNITIRYFGNVTSCTQLKDLRVLSPHGQTHRPLDTVLSLTFNVLSLTILHAVAYPGILFRGEVQQSQLRTAGRENRNIGAVAP